MQSALLNPTASTTDGVLVTAVAGKRIRVIGFIISAGATATPVTFNSKGSGAGTAISATFTAPVNNGFSPTLAPIDTGGPAGTALGGWFDTAVGEGLTVTTGAGSTTGIQVLYDVA